MMVIVAAAGVYPRGHGGARPGAFNSQNAAGLSPRARGSLSVIIRLVQPVGSIPAGTGEPVGGNAVEPRLGVYPRGHGGAEREPCATYQQAGLSPRARGSHLGRPERDGSKGSIPAGTGEPSGSPISSPLAGVYPRGHGGAARSSGHGRVDWGLSPRARGSLARLISMRARSRSIPAGTGEPRRWPCSRRATRVYPRGHGGAARLEGSA